MPRLPIPPATRALGAAALLLALAPACSEGSASGNSAEASTSGARLREIERVRVATVERRPMERVLETTAKLESEREIDVFPRTAGVVVEILCEERDRVAAGAVLARLDDSELANAELDAEIAHSEAIENKNRLLVTQKENEARLAGLELTTEQALVDYERNQRLNAVEGVASAISDQALQASRLAYNEALAAEKQAELAVERSILEVAAAEAAIQRAKLAWDRATLLRGYANITAPFEGTIAARSCRVGQELAMGQAAFTLTDPNNLRAVFPRPQADLPVFARSAREQLALTATAEATGNAVFTGSVIRTSPTIDPDSGNFRVTATLQPMADPEDPSSARLLPGMLVRLRIVTDVHPDALVVPKRALRREGEDLFLLAVEDGLVRRVRVREEADFGDDDTTEVLPLDGEALAPGTPVVVVGSRDLEDGARVEVETPAEAGTL